METTDLPHRGDAYDRTCPCRQVIHLIGDKWTVLVVDSLADGPKRFGELRRRLDGISQKVLTQTLRALERDGLVSRTVYPLPLAVEYALTPLGATTVSLLEAVRDWAETHLPDLEAARAEYDERIRAQTGATTDIAVPA